MALTTLVNSTPFILIVGGIVAVSWLLAKLLRPTAVVGEPLSSSLKIIQFFGFVVGTILLFTGTATWLAQAWDLGTQCLLIATGLALVLKPLRHVPLAVLGGLIIGVVCVGLFYLYFPLPEAVFGISSTWIYLVIFFIPAFFAYSIFRFVEDLMKLVGGILASRPVATILGLTCIIQGILLFFNASLFTIVFG